MAEARPAERRQIAVKDVAAQQVKALTGNRAAAEAAKLARVGVGLFFPIGPADEVMETFQGFIARGEIQDAYVMQMENERGIVSAQVVIAEQGVRTMFATCSQGLLWGGAPLHNAERSPIMIVVPSRAVSNSVVTTDYEDFIMQRDMGALMFYCENAQDALDTILQAYKVAEDVRVRLPVLVGYDGWEISHSTYRCSVPSQEDVDSFLPPPKVLPEQDILTMNMHEVTKIRRRVPHDPSWNQESLYKRRCAAERAYGIIEEVGEEYRQMFGRDYVGLIETHECEDAEVILITMGAITGTSRLVVNALRKRGDKVGLVKLRAFRPFPVEALVKAVSGAKVVVVVERDFAEAMITEVKAAMCGSEKQPLVMGRVVGLAGRDVSYEDIIEIFRQGQEAARSGKVDKPVDYQPLRGRSE